MLLLHESPAFYVLRIVEQQMRMDEETTAVQLHEILTRHVSSHHHAKPWTSWLDFSRISILPINTRCKQLSRNVWCGLKKTYKMLLKMWSGQMRHQYNLKHIEDIASEKWVSLLLPNLEQNICLGAGATKFFLKDSWYCLILERYTFYHSLGIFSLLKHHVLCKTTTPNTFGPWLLWN